MKISLTDRIIPTEALIIAFFDETGLKRHVFYRSLDEETRKRIINRLKKEKGAASFAASLSSFPRNILLLKLDKTKWLPRTRSVVLRKIVSWLKEEKIPAGLLNLTDFAVSSLNETESVRRMTEDLLMADFSFIRYKKAPLAGWPKIETISLFSPRLNPKMNTGLKQGQIIAEAINRCRELADTPGGEMTPRKLGAAVLKERTAKLKVDVLDEKKIAGLGMGGLLGVANGSKEKPCLIVLEYQGAKKDDRPLVFVGKGITFDSGGLNLKPSANIYEMHLDMSGGAAVIQSLAAIARLGLKVNVIGLVPAVENMPSGESYRPGDILKTITGQTVEILNTDAEGRIILADALGYGQKYRPKLIVDVATLTGAAVVALGQRMSAFFATSAELEDFGRTIGKKSGDEVWPLPLWDEYQEELKSDFADLANIGQRHYGGAILAAVFLKQFVGKFPWIHLDIAPTMTSIDGHYLAKGATGSGVRFLIELARNYQS